ncbi:hypothetical protein GX618_03280 [Candidatus Dojkabacteria bacterium]|uniref:Uncharacterized protein n=1 Tax=Candidatus Dojkabacteria bacterium TaxID=2099670 RepID=A0A847EU09_9BACT|nr:hypothetical protein [Candidatus Dojkabacteria bacterium]
MDIEDEKLKELKEALKILGFKGSELEQSVKRGEEILKKEDIEIEILIKKVLQQ